MNTQHIINTAPARVDSVSVLSSGKIRIILGDLAFPGGNYNLVLTRAEYQELADAIHESGYFTNTDVLI